jgi:hypothetical protein
VHCVPLQSLDIVGTPSLWRIESCGQCGGKVLCFDSEFPTVLSGYIAFKSHVLAVWVCPFFVLVSTYFVVHAGAWNRILARVVNT